MTKMNLSPKALSLLAVVPLMLLFLQRQARSNTNTSNSSRAKRPNILFIVSEDNGPELGCYGAPIKTPHLDQLAKEGVRFKNAFVSQAGCSQSRASFLTGLYPHQNGQIGLATWNYSLYQENTPNLINDLKNSGYRTGMIGKLHVNPASAFNIDWHEIDGPNFNRKSLDNYATAALKFFNASDDPFYLQVTYPDAHRPFLPSVDGRPAKVLTGKDVDVFPYLGITSDGLKQETADYYNCMVRLDEYVGDLLSKLKESGKYENTLIVYIGDHGADILRGKRTCYEGGLRIPFILSWKGVSKPSLVYDGLVSIIDIYPTFMEASGNRIPDYLPGKSLLPAVRGSKKPIREYLFAEYNVHSNHNPYPQRSVRDARYKLIYNVCAGYTNPGYNYTITSIVDSADFYVALNAAPNNIAKAYARMKNPPEFELYDLTNDPFEWNDLADNPAYASVLERYKKILFRWQEQTNDPFIDKRIAEKFLMEVLNTNEKKVKIHYHSYMDPHLVFQK